ncbi:hypothetical protein B0H10DRAFT_2430916 [Mycena sp. CBHHK59/15]|nr:hypothetical protein B0H10DRAFT_2430916 [Mycena sp. CBHHK59/15]
MTGRGDRRRHDEHPVESLLFLVPNHDYRCPPAFEPASVIELQSVVDSKIVGVSLYSSRAEITRLYKFAVKTGQNQLPELETLLKKREVTANALARCEKCIASLQQYLDSLTVEHLEVSKLENVIENYDAAGEKLDTKKMELNAQLKSIDTEITFERARIATPQENDILRVKASIGVFAETAGNVEIALIYAVPRATWKAFYDIRVDMEAKQDPITLIYKAAITQSTGEASLPSITSWEDVPLQLETSTPTFGLGVPTLSPWNLQIQQMHYSRPKKSGSLSLTRGPPSPLVTMTRRSAALLSSHDEGLESEMDYSGAVVTSKGNVSATFRVPGLVSIPSDAEAHNFTIVQLALKAAMSWVSVPKMDAKAHLNARITNASEYTLLCGTASVYVDGSFISRSQVPPVSPQESFDCPLGLDPSIRITYHPVIKKLSQSGFYTKTANYRLKIIDQIPASQNSQIEVKLVNPALNLPTESVSSIKAAPANTKPQLVNVTKGVLAQWDGVDESDCEVESLGLDRKLNWICTVPPQGKINLSLEWEVTVSPASAHVIGL